MTGYDSLVKLAAYNVWDKTIHKAFWVFPLDNLGKVMAVLGKQIEFDEKEAEQVLNLCPPLKERIDLPEWKGKGRIEVEREADTYIITEYRKVENNDGTISIKEVKHEIPRQNVDVLWEVMQRYPKGKRVKGIETVACHVCEQLGITRFHRPETNTWDKEKLFGARKAYYSYFYLPTKVLVHMNLIIHHKNGDIERIGGTYQEGIHDSD